MIITTLGVVAYIGIYIVSDGISSNIEHGGQYDKLSSLKANYTTLKNLLDDKKERAYTSTDGSLDINYLNAVSAVNVASSSIDNVDSAIYANKPASEIDDQIKNAEDKINIAYKFVNKL